MGRFLNKGNSGFENARNGEYVDKSAMIQIINETLRTEMCCTCVTRARRFGKSMAAKMLYAYYDKSCDSRSLFEDLAIAKMPSFEKHLNKYPTIYLDVTSFTTDYKDNPDIVNIMQQTIKKEACALYPEVRIEESDNLMAALFAVADSTKERFIFIIDEWDAICREFDKAPKVMDAYVNLLRRMFKTDETAQVFAGVYMTGILPIKRYNTESALNNFREYTMVDPGSLAPYFGFTPSEMEMLAVKYDANIDELRMWYDGYKIGDEDSIYNPYSVMEALRRHRCRNYWTQTGAFDSIATYIQMNFDGLKDAIFDLLGGGKCGVDTLTFTNDLSKIKSKDDVLTVLIHLGFLTYDDDLQECYVPNLEVGKALEMAVKESDWTDIVDLIKSSKELLEATINGDEDAVAYQIEKAHEANTSILKYNNENSLACVLSIAYIYAKNEYSIHREYASGKGYADLVMMPRRNSAKPAMVIELKYDKDIKTAIDQIRDKDYPESLREYSDNLLLVGTTYDRKTKQHVCRIER